MKIISLIIISCLLLVACKVDVQPGPQGDPGSQGATAVRPTGDTAAIYGKVSLYDEFTKRPPHFDSVKVTLRWGKDSLVQLTDTAGNYLFHHVETGTYDLVFEKEGFGTMKVITHTHQGGGKDADRIDDIVLMQKPVLTAARNLRGFTYDSLNHSPAVIAYFDLGVGRSTFPFYSLNFDVFISNRPNPGPRNFLYESAGVTVDYSKPDSTYELYVFAYNFSQYFQPGDSVYVSLQTFTRYYYTPTPGQEGVPDEGVWSTVPIKGLMSYLDPVTDQEVWPSKSTPLYASAPWGVKVAAPRQASATLQTGHD